MDKYESRRSEPKVFRTSSRSVYVEFRDEELPALIAAIDGVRLSADWADLIEGVRARLEQANSVR